MSQGLETVREQPSPQSGLDNAVHQVLSASESPLTPANIRSKLPAAFRHVTPEELADYLHRQVAAGALYEFPKYRSSQLRFWDRSMHVHAGHLLRLALQQGPSSWSAVRRRLPSYVLAQANSALADQIARGLVHRHPRSRGMRSDRFALLPADPKDYLRGALERLFQTLEQLGFTSSQLRQAALEILHDEEWSP